jgi:pyridoxine 5'-phosphate synthase PdxJ
MLNTIININPFSHLEHSDGYFAAPALKVLKALAARNIVLQITPGCGKAISPRCFETIKALGAKLDMQMGITAGNLEHAADVRPETCTLALVLPDCRGFSPLPAAMYQASTVNAVGEIHSWGGRVFISSGIEAGDIEAVAASGADGIEFSFLPSAIMSAREELCYLNSLNRATEVAAEKGLQISFSGNIEIANIPAILRIKRISRVNTTFALFTRSLDCGASKAMDDILNLLKYYND